MASNTQPIAVIARLLDLSERRVQQLGREGVIPKAERGQYELVGSVRGYVRYLRDQIVRAESGAADLGSERARLTKAKADLAEMDAAVRRSDLLDAKDVEEAWIALLARLRTRLLGLPDRLAPIIHEEATIAGARRIVKTAIAETLGELAGDPVLAAAHTEGQRAAGAGGAEGAGDPEAAAGAHDQ